LILTLDIPVTEEHIVSGDSVDGLQASFSERAFMRSPKGEIQQRRTYIEPVHYRGGFRLSSLIGRES
jgi:hypothetical protein